MAATTEYKLFVRNLPWTCDERMLQDKFGEHGTIVACKLCVDRETGRSKGFGFITYGTEEEYNTAMKAMNNTDMDGREIEVKPANADGARPPRGDDRRGGDRGDREQRGGGRGDSYNNHGGGGGGKGPCYAFQRGECTRGDSCRFSHDSNGGNGGGGGGGGHHNSNGGGEKRSGVCFQFQRGECTRGASCKFSHEVEGGGDSKRSRHDDDRY